MSIPELPLFEINSLIRALNRANAAMREHYKGTGLEGPRNHFELLEHGSVLAKPGAPKTSRGGRFVETRPNTLAIETRSGNTSQSC